MSVAFSRLLRFVISHLALLALTVCSHAQILVVDVPDNPPHDFLYHASEGNLYFEKYQAQELSEELRKFYEDTGFAVYLVTVNSPSKMVIENLQQQIKTKWKESRDCMVILYDLDTQMLAVQFEQFYREKDGLMMPSKLLGVPEKAWVSHVDEWMKTREQKSGLEMRLALPFFRDFLAFMRQELVKVSGTKPKSRAWYMALSGVILLAFLIYWWLQKFAQKFASDVEYHFPSMQMNHRLKARFGGGLLSVRHMAPPRAPR